MEKSGAEIRKRDTQAYIHALISSYERQLVREGHRIKGFRYSLKLLIQFTGSPESLLSLNFKEAQAFQGDLLQQEHRFSRSTILVILGPLSAFYERLRKQKIIQENPFSLMDRIKGTVTLPRNIPDENDLAVLMDGAAHFTKGKNLREFKRDYKLHILCEFLYSTGMRISEAAAVRLEDLDLDEGTVLVRDSKTRSRRTAFLNDYLVRILRIYIDRYREQVLWLHNGADENLLFGAGNNLKVWFNENLARLCKGMGIPVITSHMFRHAFGYHMLRAGCDIRKIQSFLGHNRLNTTGVYTKVDRQALRNILDQYHPRGGVQQK